MAQKSLKDRSLNKNNFKISLKIIVLKLFNMKINNNKYQTKQIINNWIKY